MPFDKISHGQNMQRTKHIMDKISHRQNMSLTNFSWTKHLIAKTSHNIIDI